MVRNSFDSEEMFVLHKFGYEWSDFDVSSFEISGSDFLDPGGFMCAEFRRQGSSCCPTRRACRGVAIVLRSFGTVVKLAEVLRLLRRKKKVTFVTSRRRTSEIVNVFA